VKDATEPDYFYIDGRKISIYRLDEVFSTMDYSSEIARKGAEYWSVITAEEQTEGRGTHGRQWSSPRGKSLLMSIILPPPYKTDGLENLSIECAQILIDVIKKDNDVAYTIKKPNDILIDGKKVCGILLESVSDSERILSLILGIGINLYQEKADFINDRLGEAVSIYIASGKKINKNNIIKNYLDKLIPFYENKYTEAAP